MHRSRGRFFEWQATNGDKQPHAIAMKNGAPFGLAGLWENWKDPETREWVRTFTIVTVRSNDLIARIHDRIPAILRPQGCDRWLGTDPDPYDLLVTFPSEPMRMWQIWPTLPPPSTPAARRRKRRQSHRAPSRGVHGANRGSMIGG